MNVEATTTAPATPSNATPDNEVSNMKRVHLTLQGKGGVGKSFVSSLVTQYLMSLGAPVVAVDTDPVNATLCGYTAFNTRRIELMDGGSLIERNFDALIEQIVEEDTNFVVDNGASSFIPLSFYLNENDAIRTIREHGKEVVIHTVVTGGQAMRDTVSGLYDLMTQMPPEASIVVWLNEFFGDVVADGQRFEDAPGFQKNRSRITGLVRIARQTGSTFGRDVQLMLDSKLTFDQVAQSPDFGLMAKSRLARVRAAIFDQLALVI